MESTKIEASRPDDSESPTEARSDGSEKGVTGSEGNDARKSYEVFLEYKKDLDSARISSFESFDQSVLTLSSAALGVSLAFIKDVVELDSAVFIPALVISWISFAVAILSTMTSFVSSRMAIDAQLDLTERGLLHGERNALEETPKASVWTGRLNWLSAGAFAVGIVTTLIFVMVNLFGG